MPDKTKPKEVREIKKANARVPSSFGLEFSDHMLKVEYDSASGGWQQAEITELQNISLHPAAKALNYATSVFEGMKAYRGVDGKIRLFRPQLNLQRLNRGATRACLPTIDVELLFKAIKELIAIDQEFIPYSTQGSLYIRPTLIGIDADLSVTPNKKSLLYVITSPCGNYFSSGLKPLRLCADPTYTRAWPGGCGEYKMSCNYAPTLYADTKARELGCQNVLWLYGPEEQLTEIGVSALFMVYLNDQQELEVVTPPLEDGLILHSITRRSVLDLAAEWNEFKVSERRLTMAQVLHLKKENRLLEIFGAGTACVVAPVGEIYYKGDLITIPTIEQNNPIFARFLKALTDIQYGVVQHPWAEEVDVDVQKYTSTIKTVQS